MFFLTVYNINCFNIWKGKITFQLGKGYYEWNYCLSEGYTSWCKGQISDQNLYWLWCSMMVAIFFFLLTPLCLPAPNWLLHVLTCPVTWKCLNRPTYCIWSTLFNCIYAQRNLRFPSRLDHWLFQDWCQIAVSIDAGFTVNSASGFRNNKHCFILAL